MIKSFFHDNELPYEVKFMKKKTSWNSWFFVKIKLNATVIYN